MTHILMLFPLLIEIIAYCYTLDNNLKQFSTLEIDEDRTVESRALIDQFVNTRTFRVVGEAQRAEALSEAIRQGKAFVGIQIPTNFTRDLRAGQTAQVQVLINGSSSTIASSALNT